MTQAINTLNSVYRAIPALDKLLLIPQVIGLCQQYGNELVKIKLRHGLNQLRATIAHKGVLPTWYQGEISLIEHLRQDLAKVCHHSLTPVINLSGTMLHTNLGRSQLCESAIHAVTQVMRYPVPLEFDLDAGQRGHRDQRVSHLLQELIDAPASCVVNNNAAAVLLMLSSIAAGKEVIVSRGELVEIGGAFRIPDIMTQAGCKLVEVGCTNRTHLSDYARAITDNTAAIMKVHCSNYHIQGFTASVPEKELASLCQEKGIFLLSDLGSGALTDLSKFGLTKEATPKQLLTEGVDLVSFSGDKLLGGPQAGLVVGNNKLIAKLQSHPLKRALRCDKMTLAALEATLLEYLNPNQLANAIPSFRKCSRTIAELQIFGEHLISLCGRLAEQFQVTLRSCQTQVGSGAQPDVTLPSLAMCFYPIANISLVTLEQLFRSANTPIIGRINSGCLWLDLRCCDDDAALAMTLVGLNAKCHTEQTL